MDDQLLFLKFGGSLITDKSQTEKAHTEVITNLLRDLQTYTAQHQGIRLILGHGSGSYGHHAAAKHNTRTGVTSPAQWQGFVEVWRSARKLNQVVLNAAETIGLPLISFPPSASLTAKEKHVLNWDIQPIEKALQAGLIPVIYGDVVFDEVLGGTIFSTEELFFHLASQLKPSRVLLAGKESAVFADYPLNQTPIRNIDKHAPLEEFIKQSESLDVTGGMRSKVAEMQALCRQSEHSKVEIFSANKPGELLSALNGLHSGTIIS